jgi:hypothetical protein
MNPNHAELLRVTVREPELLGGDEAPDTTPPTFRFDIVVEGRAGGVLGASAQPYTLGVSAFDFTAGFNPDSGANTFNHQRVERFDAAHGWPDKLARFEVLLKDADAVEGHLLKCFATLISANGLTSFVESPLFLVHLSAPPPPWTHRKATE